MHGNTEGVAMPRSAFLDSIRSAIRVRHYSRQTEKAYVYWTRQFILFHGKRHPNELDGKAVESFLTWLAVKRKVAPSTQNQALCALLFVYREVLGKQLPWMDNVIRARRQRHVPTVLSREEVDLLFANMRGVARLIAELIYGSGIRQIEALRLRVGDLDFNYRQVVVRSGKGNKDRVTVLPKRVTKPLQQQLTRVRELHAWDLQQGYGEVWLPYALERKYKHAAREWAWQYVFPSARLSPDPECGKIRRYHVSPATIQKAVRNAARQAGITRRVGTHTLRHCFATHLLEAGADIRTIQELLGHKDVSTTMIYTHVIRRGAAGVKSPLDP